MYTEGDIIILLLTKIANNGWVAYAFDVTHPAHGISPTDFSIDIKRWDQVRENAGKVLNISEVAGGVRLETEPVDFRGFRIKGSGEASAISFSRENVTEVITEWADKFEARNEREVLYRLYSPDASGPRPLVLFLHGGGECGSDNWTQMTGTLGAAHCRRLSGRICDGTSSTKRAFRSAQRPGQNAQDICREQHEG